ncbi:protein IRX15-LIKE-like [Triticum dicoccoides]|uniref:protein IRX15-LIKE-like n=1 Tax=Triticum dicoccoides TaxID=85692 RepID=UPI000E79152B|nr:protein IRX15-LIKE-like [Triticum dicoccoides]
MKAMSGTKLLLVRQPSSKYGNGAVSPATATSISWRRFWLVAFLALFTCASLLTVFSTARAPSGAASPGVTFVAAGVGAGSVGGASAGGGALPAYVFDALVRYAAAAGANSTVSMPEEDVRAIASVVRRRAPCNLLVFGLGAETPLWRALNHGGRTVFLDENPFYVAHMEGAHGGLEAYDVAYATAVRELPDLLDAARASRRAECRPVQNLLFSDCSLAIGDLPNQLYDVAWDVILVDGPHGYAEGSPGRMAAIYSSAVMARTKGTVTDVLVHDYEREVESVCAREFLCDENRVEGTTTPSLGHYIVRGGAAANREAFCGAQKPAGSTTKKAN